MPWRRTGRARAGRTARWPVPSPLRSRVTDVERSAAAAARPALRVEGVTYRFGARAAVQAPDFALGPGEHGALVGPSGSGKTTLLHLLAGILVPATGRILLGDEDVHRPARDDRWRACRIGVVPQKLHLLESLSALGNVRLAQYCAGRPDDASAAAAQLRALGLDDAQIARRPSALSQGQQQRVAIARALINGPTLLLADEPTAALDDAAATRAIDVLLGAAALGRALLIVATHDARIRGRFARVVDLGAPEPAA
jgi:ABC-type lipoprotein export system ATPase subunit